MLTRGLNLADMRNMLFVHFRNCAHMNCNGRLWNITIWKSKLLAIWQWKEFDKYFYKPLLRFFNCYITTCHLGTIWILGTWCFVFFVFFKLIKITLLFVRLCCRAEKTKEKKKKHSGKCFKHVKWQKWHFKANFTQQDWANRPAFLFSHPSK